MKYFKMIVPVEQVDKSANHDFLDWLERLHTGGICAQVYRNSSIDTAKLLERAHPNASVFVLEITYSDSYIIGTLERTNKTMDEITCKIQEDTPRNVVCIEHTMRAV